MQSHCYRLLCFVEDMRSTECPSILSVVHLLIVLTCNHLASAGPDFQCRVGHAPLIGRRRTAWVTKHRFQSNYLRIDFVFSAGEAEL